MAQSGFDRRRVNGPSESFQPTFDDGLEESNILYENWKLGEVRRKRQAGDIRPICALASVIALLHVADSRRRRQF